MKPYHQKLLDEMLDFSPPRKPQNQAERIIEKFGGVPNLAKVLKEIGCPKNETSIRRWAYPISKYGTGGVIPPHMYPAIIKAANYEGIILTAEDWEPIVK